LFSEFSRAQTRSFGRDQVFCARAAQALLRNVPRACAGFDKYAPREHASGAHSAPNTHHISILEEFKERKIIKIMVKIFWNLRAFSQLPENMRRMQKTTASSLSIERETRSQANAISLDRSHWTSVLPPSSMTETMQWKQAHRISHRVRAIAPILSR